MQGNPEETLGPLLKRQDTRRRDLLRSVLHQPASFWLRLVLGLIFVASSIGKIRYPAAFAQIIYNYQILPDASINLLALTLPWLEAILGLCLISGIWLQSVVLLTNLLLSVFFGTLAFNAARGLNVHCGCFTTSLEGDPATFWYLFRDAIFMALSGLLLFKTLVQRPIEACETVDSQ